MSIIDPDRDALRNLDRQLEEVGVVPIDQQLQGQMHGAPVNPLAASQVQSFAAGNLLPSQVYSPGTAPEAQRAIAADITARKASGQALPFERPIQRQSVVSPSGTADALPRGVQLTPEQVAERRQAAQSRQSDGEARRASARQRKAAGMGVGKEPIRLDRSDPRVQEGLAAERERETAAPVEQTQEGSRIEPNVRDRPTVNQIRALIGDPPEGANTAEIAAWTARGMDAWNTLQDTVESSEGGVSVPSETVRFFRQHGFEPPTEGAMMSDRRKRELAAQVNDLFPLMSNREKADFALELARRLGWSF